MSTKFNPETVMEVEGLGKQYQIYDSPRARMKSLLLGTGPQRSHWALKNVSFSLTKGQCLGLVGDNGAGKSTLLKLLTGTLQPSTGKLTRQGRLTAILELGAGFHPDFTGRQNLYFGGSLMGLSAEEIKRLEPSIIEFSELEAAIDRPVKTYSSGMTVRLAFALVTAVEPAILIIDEALAVGDQHFQKKCIERIDQFRESGCTIIFCSHSLYHVRHLCDVSLWLSGGQVQAFGPTEHVLASYETHVRQQDDHGEDPELRAVDAPRPVRTLDQAGLVSIEVEGLTADTPPLLPGPDLVIHVRGRVPDGSQPSFGLMLEQQHGVGITSLATHAEHAQSQVQNLGDGLWGVTLRFPDLPLHSGEYKLSGYLFDSQGLVTLDEWMNAVVFKWVSPSLTPGLVRLPHRWEPSLAG
ncbi:ABC transporter ATP-binding protein [Curvibacter sp. RS43]|jgi:lipopolysaccharide transport system ATP-binding protein|uniref:ABC transporter ATP-binding protein n=1 Tax=Curvibacter microcysteis TaxID=3026419 RepID=UPI00235DDC67|nr:ABC transporter ATP-binding protein [Curvibacter sp. RS43]MDD0811443.1 ABC transporter ATP-binding protein [Curvibacter sp. RS43]